MHHLLTSAVSVLLLAGTVTSAATAEGWADLIQTTGIIGVLLLHLYGFHSGWWVIGRHHQQALDRNEQLVRKLEAQREVMETQTIPLLVRATDIMSRILADGRDP